MTLVKRQKGWRMSCDVGEVTERLENRLLQNNCKSILKINHDDTAWEVRKLT